MTPRGRYAPSPTGTLHLGNASTALLAWLSVRARGGEYRMRIEDLDRPRVVPGATSHLLDDLSWLGIDWDGEPVVQSERTRSYDAAMDSLRTTGAVYPCFCSRKDVAAAASAPQAPGDEVSYPGTCRALAPEVAARRIEAGAVPSWRFRIEPDDHRPFEDLVRGEVGPEAGALGDFVVRRADGVAAYQLAVVVDDAAMGITEVVRGGDLVASTFRQLALYRALSSRPPAFGHVPLLLGADGVRLSKRHRGVTLAEMRTAGWSPERVSGWLAGRLGLRPSEAPVPARALIEGFALEHLFAVPREITVS